MILNERSPMANSIPNFGWELPSTGNLQRLAMELTVSHANFRATCVKTLTQILHIGTKSVQDWGQDMSFHKMPKIHKYTLGYALAAISKSSSKNLQKAA
jgi:hypothetical protein